jgi:hypothetical protein
MKKLAVSLEQAGFGVANLSYPSRKYPIETLSTMALEQSLAQCPINATIHFVTHSLGGILLRDYLSKNVIKNLSRVVMLGPPNQGSEVVNVFGKLPGFTWINGPAGRQLGTSELSKPKSLGPLNCELGIIAGTKSFNLILSLCLPGENDGKVTVQSTKLMGMTEHLSMPVTHPFMMRNPAVIQQVIQFLIAGHFKVS